MLYHAEALLFVFLTFAKVLLTVSLFYPPPPPPPKPCFLVSFHCRILSFFSFLTSFLSRTLFVTLPQEYAVRKLDDTEFKDDICIFSFFYSCSRLSLLYVPFVPILQEYAVRKLDDTEFKDRFGNEKVKIIYRNVTYVGVKFPTYIHSVMHISSDSNTRTYPADKRPRKVH